VKKCCNWIQEKIVISFLIILIPFVFNKYDPVIVFLQFIGVYFFIESLIQLYKSKDRNKYLYYHMMFGGVNRRKIIKETDDVYFLQKYCEKTKKWDGITEVNKETMKAIPNGEWNMTTLYFKETKELKKEFEKTWQDQPIAL